MTGGRRGSRVQAQLGTAFDLRAYRHPKAYVRVSTDEQAEEGTSIEVQTQQLRAYFGAFGLALTGDDLYVDDGWSGKDLSRPEIERLRNDARDGRVDCVLVTKLDRFSRNLRDTVNLCLGEWHDEAPENRRVVLKSITEPFDTHTDFGRMVFGLLAMFAEFERRRIAERTWAGKASRAEAGRNAGQRPPYGFCLVPWPDGRGSTFAVVPEEADVVRRICQSYLHGLGDEQIAHTLNDQGLRYREGALWQTQQVTRILTNPLIAGTYVYGRHARGPDGVVRRLPEGEWVTSQEPAVPTPIITPSEFERLKDLRASRRRAGRGPTHSYLLSGLVRCGRCGAACAVKVSGPGGEHRYYSCTRRRQSGTMACGQLNIRLDKLDRLVGAAVQSILAASAPLISPRLAEWANRQRRKAMARLDEVQVELGRVRKAREDYFTWLEQGLLRPNAVQQRLDELAATELHLCEERRRVEIAAQPAQASLAAIVGSGDKPNRFSGAFTALQPNERRLLVRALISRIEVHGKQVRIHWAHDYHRIDFVIPECGQCNGIISANGPTLG